MSMMPPPPPPPTPPRPPVPNPAEQAGLHAAHQLAQLRAAQGAAAYVQAHRNRAATEGGSPATIQTSASSAAARVWLVVACLLILGAMLYVVVIR